MDADRFDTLARTLQVDRRRLDALARAIGRPHSRRATLAALLGLVAAAPNRARAEQDGCNAERRRGEACTDNCQCRGDNRCGDPRPGGDRAECGQHEEARQVCCLGQGDTCGDNDCACCGTMVCQDGRCRRCSSASGCCLTPAGCPTPTDPCMVAVCTNGTCGSVRAKDGAVCGTSTNGGGTRRCCNGACPDPDCLPSGVPLNGCEGVLCDQGSCCSGTSYTCNNTTQKCRCGWNITGGVTRCGTDAECQLEDEARACICGTCQVPPS
jgi:hypothetical protein